MLASSNFLQGNNSPSKKFNNVNPLKSSQAPPQLTDFLDIEKLIRHQEQETDPKKKFYDEVFALDNLEIEKQKRQSTNNLSITRSSSLDVLKDKKYNKHKKSKKKYYFNLYDDELQRLPQRQNVRLVRNLVDYLRFYCPSYIKLSKKSKKRISRYRLIDIEEILHFPLLVPPSLAGILSLLQSESNPSNIGNELFSSVPMYSSSLVSSSQSRWRMPSKDLKVEDDMTKGLSKSLLSSSRGSAFGSTQSQDLPNTAASHSHVLSSSSAAATSSSTLSAASISLTEAALEEENQNELRLKYVLELLLRFHHYFLLSKMKPIEWFDILTNYKKGDDQNLYYNEFYYGLIKFCKEMNLIMFREHEIEILFQYFVKSSLWCAFMDQLNGKQKEENLRQLQQQQLAPVSSSGVPTLIPTRLATPLVDNINDNSNFPIKEILPYITRHDFKIGFKKLKLSQKRILWLNHQGNILKRCAFFLQSFNISLYHYSMNIMKSLSKKKDSIHNSSSYDFIDSLDSIDDEKSIISTSNLSNIHNLTLLENRYLTTSQLESLLSKLLNDVMIFLNCKDIDKVLAKYQNNKGNYEKKKGRKNGGGGSGSGSFMGNDCYDDGSSVLSDISADSQEKLRNGKHPSMKIPSSKSNDDSYPNRVPLDMTKLLQGSLSADPQLNEELSTKSLFDDIHSESPSQDISDDRSSSIMNHSIGSITSSLSPSKKSMSSSFLDPISSSSPNGRKKVTPKSSPEKRLLQPLNRGLSFKAVPTLIQSKSLSSKDFLMSETNSPSGSSVSSFQDSPTRKSILVGSKSLATVHENGIHDNGSAEVNISPVNRPSIAKQKSVRMSFAEDTKDNSSPILATIPSPSAASGTTLLSRSRSSNNLDKRDETLLSEDEMALTYITDELRNSIFDYNFEASRPNSKGGIGLNDGQGNSLSRANSLSIRKRSSSWDDNNSLGSNNSNNSASYRRVSSKLKQEFGSRDFSEEASVESFENISKKHFLIREFSTKVRRNSVLAMPTPAASSKKLQREKSILPSSFSSPPTSVPDVILSAESNVNIKDPVLDNPNQFYKEYKQFEVKMQEENQKHLKYYNSITQHFDRRISLAKVRLNQFYGNDNNGKKEK
jgi:hypothetical protein